MDGKIEVWGTQLITRQRAGDKMDTIRSFLSFPVSQWLSPFLLLSQAFYFGEIDESKGSCCLLLGILT